MKFTFEITDFLTAEAHLRLPPSEHADHFLSIGSHTVRKPRGLEDYAGNRLALTFDDILWEPTPESNMVAPSREHVQEIIDFGRTIEGGHLLVHCQAGISRSTAATLMVLALNSAPSHAKELDELVRRARPTVRVRPNDLMLEYADDILDWGGELAALGGWGVAREGFPYRGAHAGRVW
jgi:predicted protein tyrosine phosphatase